MRQSEFLLVLNVLKLTIMKKIITILSVALSVLGYAQTFVANGITYEVISGTNNVSVTGYNTASGNQVSIPKTVLYEKKGTTSKYNVTEVGLEAFKSKGLISISLPEGLTKIKNRAFADNSISGILTIPNSITHIEAHAFNTNSIDSLDLGTGITAILTGVFSRNDLTSLTLPSQIAVVDWGAFGYNPIATLTIENGVGQINARAFWDNALTKIVSNSIVPPTITTGGNDDSFNMDHNVDDRANIDLIIPSGTTGAYVTDNGAKWTGFKSVTESTVTSLNEKTAIEELSVYPNPATTNLTLDLSQNIEEVKVLDVLGNNIGVFTPYNNSVDISTLPSGVYVVQVQVNGKVLSKKVIKK